MQKSKNHLREKKALEQKRPKFCIKKQTRLQKLPQNSFDLNEQHQYLQKNCCIVNKNMVWSYCILTKKSSIKNQEQKSSEM